MIIINHQHSRKTEEFLCQDDVSKQAPDKRKHLHENQIRYLRLEKTAICISTIFALKSLSLSKLMRYSESPLNSLSPCVLSDFIAFRFYSNTFNLTVPTTIGKHRKFTFFTRSLLLSLSMNRKRL